MKELSQGMQYGDLFSKQFHSFLGSLRLKVQNLSSVPSAISFFLKDLGAKLSDYKLYRDILEKLKASLSDPTVISIIDRILDAE